jgi:hypothetical protein
LNAAKAKVQEMTEKVDVRVQLGGWKSVVGKERKRVRGGRIQVFIGSGQNIHEWYRFSG